MRCANSSFAVEVPFSCSASHHQRSRTHEARPEAANEIRQPSDSGLGADEQIQIEDKKWLDRANFAGLVTDDEISVVELLVDCILDEFIIAAVLCLGAESI